MRYTAPVTIRRDPLLIHKGSKTFHAHGGDPVDSPDRLVLAGDFCEDWQSESRDCRDREMINVEMSVLEAPRTAEGKKQARESRKTGILLRWW